MPAGTVVATANVKYELSTAAAREALELVLEAEPDLVCLQEWTVLRRRLLAERPEYAWWAPWFGECVVGARVDRYDRLDRRVVGLSAPGWAESPHRPLGLEPPRLACEATYLDRVTGRMTTAVSFHLVPGVQHEGRYRIDRPRLVARHRREVRRLQALVDRRRASGDEVYVAGDSNFDGFTLSGLDSAWQGRDAADGGTLGRRRIDDVFAPRPTSDLRLLTTPSDHRALVTTVPAARE